MNAVRPRKQSSSANGAQASAPQTEAGIFGARLGVEVTRVDPMAAKR